MTRPRNLLLSSLYTLLLGLTLGGCATASSSGKASPANYGGDAAQPKSPEETGATEPQDEPAAHQFASAPDDRASAAAEFESAGSASQQSAPTEYHRAAPSAAQRARGSALDQSRSPSPANAEMNPLPRSGAHPVAKPTPSPKSVERPGLATLWGETRESRVTTTSFTRTGNQPWFVFRIQYDDEAGIRSRTGLDPVSFGSSHGESQYGLVTVEIVDANGNPLTGFMQGSHPLVIGHQGDRYGIRITNHSNERFEAVAKVDGLDVLDGRPGSYVKRGYLLDANSSLEIDGFRRSSSEVAAFRFGAVKDSYAARTSGDRNVGVIGVALFREYQRISPDRIEENRRRDNADPFPRYATPPPVPMIRN